MNSVLYYNGTILTMKTLEDRPEALLVKDGRIAATGRKDDLLAIAGEHTGCRDLHGHTLMPAFLDAHSHFSGYANSLLQVPLEEAASFEDIVEKLRDYIREHQIPEGEWIVGKGYDHNFLMEKTHPRREVLDLASASHPIVIQHASGHVGVFNTRALELLKITKDTPCPDGGTLEQINGVPSGYMEENAFISYLQKAPTMPSMEKLMDAFQTVQYRYASYGITTIQEGYFAKQLIPLYEYLLEHDLLFLDVVGYPDWKDGKAVYDSFPKARKSYDRHLKLNGYKMFLDGSPQGRTAWMRKPYIDDETYNGYNTMDSSDVTSACQAALEQQLQILAHCNGDAASAQYLRCYEEALIKWNLNHPGKCPPDIRPVIIHAQLLGIDQLSKVKALGMLPSFFIAHIYHWGDIHIRNFGLERASHLSPAGSALKENIRFTFHQDSPVILPDMAETLWCAAARHTKNGIQLGADECISVWEALKAVTVNAAWQYQEETEKGTLAPGKRADLVILEENPLDLPDLEKLRNLKVLETIKDGKTIFSRNE